jgi:hypothetical protein
LKNPLPHGGEREGGNRGEYEGGKRRERERGCRDF